MTDAVSDLGTTGVPASGEAGASDRGPADEAGTAEFWFDPTCPYTWLTSRWLVDVADRSGLSVSFHVMSLARLHLDRNGNAPSLDEHAGEGPTAALRALAAAEQAGGQESLGRLYTLLGTRMHDGGQELTPDSIRQSVHDAGLPDDVGAAVDDPTFDNVVATSHDRGQQRAGMQTGSPILALGEGRGYFGPVLTDLPGDQDALRLFEAVRLLTTVPSFSEIKTARG